MSMRSLPTLVIAWLLLGSGAAVWTGEAEDPAPLFREALEHAEGGRLEQAVAAMERARARAPDHPSVLWNLGLWYAELNRHEKALEIWKRYRDLEPDDWHARAKLIQTYQALGRTELRDRERAALLEWYAAAEEDDRPEQDLFCREQFVVGNRRIMAFEYFEPAGERRVFFRFSVLDVNGEEDFWYSLGSYDVTTQIARETGEIGEEDRLYHLDQYGESYHATMSFMREMPTYGDVRKQVVASLESKSTPAGSTRSGK
jgi:tetratricopeptide (TPR) repeat protein